LSTLDNGIAENGAGEDLWRATVQKEILSFGQALVFSNKWFW
jgi:hypothetical protein